VDEVPSVTCLAHDAFVIPGDLFFTSTAQITSASINWVIGIWLWSWVCLESAWRTVQGTKNALMFHFLRHPVLH